MGEELSNAEGERDQPAWEVNSRKFKVESKALKERAWKEAALGQAWQEEVRKV
jgi:hypothetical protein